MLLMCAVLVSLISCGNPAKMSELDQSETSHLDNENSEAFILPDLNQHRVVTVDSSISGNYENNTINPKKLGKVLGDYAFFIMINEESNPHYDQINLFFYSKTKVNSVFYADLKGNEFNFLNADKSTIRRLGFKENTDFYKNDLIWGERNIDYPLNDMLNKAYIVNTEEIANKNNREFKAESSYLMWFECSDAIKDVQGIAYTCGKHNLKFHYKLLDYSLTSKK